MDLILPQEELQLVQDRLERESCSTPAYYRVNMTLGQVLEGDFFTEYVKIGMKITRRVRILNCGIEAYVVAIRQYHDVFGGKSGCRQRVLT